MSQLYKAFVKHFFKIKLFAAGFFVGASAVIICAHHAAMLLLSNEFDEKYLYLLGAVFGIGLVFLLMRVFEFSVEKYYRGANINIVSGAQWAMPWHAIPIIITCFVFGHIAGVSYVLVPDDINSVYITKTLFSSLLEEILFRTIIFQLFSIIFGPHVGNILQAALFSEAHNPFDLPRWLLLFFSGIAYGYITFFYKSIIPSTFLHGANNILVSSIDSLVGGTQNVANFGASGVKIIAPPEYGALFGYIYIFGIILFATALIAIKQQDIILNAKMVLYKYFLRRHRL